MKKESVMNKSAIVWSLSITAIVTFLLVMLLIFVGLEPKPVQKSVSATAAITKAEALPPAPPKLLGVHTVIPRDTLWWISDKWYHDPVLWPAIYEINKSIIKDPDLIYAGQLFDIPYLDRSGKEMSGNDATLLSQGYLEAYRVYKAKGKAHSEDYKTVGDGYAKK
jgi:hypothetical protein